MVNHLFARSDLQLATPKVVNQLMGVVLQGATGADSDDEAVGFD